MISPFSNANSPGSVGSKGCKARTRVTILPLSAIAEPDLAPAGVVVVVLVTAVAAAGVTEELAGDADGVEDTWLCDCGCGWVCGCR